MSQVRAHDVDSRPSLETLEVAHVARSTGIDVYGGRRLVDGEPVHGGDVEAGDPGWLGSPFALGDQGDVEDRRRMIAAYLRWFLDRVNEDDDDYREAIEDLRGKRVSCWCRGVTQPRTPETWCHLDVVAAWLSRDLSPVFDYLRGEA